MKAFFAVTLAVLLFVSAVSAQEETAVAKKEDEKKPVEHFAWPGFYGYNWHHPVAFRAPHIPVAAVPYPGHYQYQYQWY